MGTSKRDDMAFEIAFTPGFKHGLSRLPQRLYPIIDRQVTWLEDDQCFQGAQKPSHVHRPGQ
jgi:hypothetical protein